jgi:ribosome-binding factor A
MADHRRERVEHLVRGEIARLLQQEAKDPRLGAISVSEVRMTADLRQARVFFRIVGDRLDVAGATRALERATPFLRGAVSRALGLRVTPALAFEYDVTLDRARRLEALLSGERPGADPEDEETP